MDDELIKFIKERMEISITEVQKVSGFSREKILNDITNAHIDTFKKRLEKSV